LRVSDMRGIDLGVFDFDYDLTWSALFLNAEGRVYGRYGGRTPDSASALYSLKGLRHALTSALERHRQGAAPPSVVPETRKVEDFPAARRLPDKACLHCHHVYDFRREALQAAGRWKLDEVWVNPEPANIGLTLSLERGDHVIGVAADSAAERVGLRNGDVLATLNGRPIASIADAQYALHLAPAQGEVPITWRRGRETLSGKLTLAAGWRKTDVSWRWSLRGLAPASQVHGDDLTAEEKKILGLGPTALAFRQGNFVTRPAREAGIRINDILLGVDGKRLDLSARQFDAFIRLNYKVGDVVTYNILRGKERLDLELKLNDR
jgi:serine protease Do